MDFPTLRATFVDPEQGYIAIYRMRGAGFRVDIAGSSTGDIVVSASVGPERIDEFTTLVEECEGRIGSPAT